MRGASCGACNACGTGAASSQMDLKREDCDYVVALAGNPNVGKSTVFNRLTGLKQHTGNWPGKTVTRAEGAFQSEGRRYQIVDLPGTYSLLSASVDEEIARDFVLFGHPDCTIVVVDATALERNLNLVLQVLEITDRAVVCLNLMDEARRKGIAVDHTELARELGVPVVPAAARRGEGMDLLVRTVAAVSRGEVPTNPHRIQGNDDFRHAVGELAAMLALAYPLLPNTRWVAMRLLDGDYRVRQALENGELGAWHRGAPAAAGTEQPGQPAQLARSPQSDLADRSGAPAGAAGATVARPAAGAPADTAAAPQPGAASATQHRPAAGAAGAILTRADTLRRGFESAFRDKMVEATYADAEAMARKVVRKTGPRYTLDERLDRVVTSRIWGIPLMALLLAAVFWVTITGANIPSALLADALFRVEDWAAGLFGRLGAPWWLTGFLWHGVYRGLAWVISVMLPPMAIFFPIFTLLEDLGYLPRVAFNMDRLFQKAGAHGKQALTMSMGLGCNAAGVVACRIIDSPRERLIAILTNNFMPCNGRWPTLILLATLFVAASFSPAVAAFAAAGSLVAVVGLGGVITLLVSAGLSRTVLRGEPSSFTLELPPYRRPNVLQVIYTSIIDRTLLVLWRAVVMAAPAGGVIWLMSNVHVMGRSLTAWTSGWLDPIGHAIGLDGVILLAYIIAIPANEIIVPTILMAYLNQGMMIEMGSLAQIKQVLVGQHGWTVMTAISLMLFSLLHNPCSTAIWTIYQETKSAKWAAVGTLLPLAIAFALLFLLNQGARLLGLA